MLDESKNKNIDLLTTEAEKLGPDESMRRVTKLLYFREWILWKDICKCVKVLRLLCIVLIMLILGVADYCC